MENRENSTSGMTVIGADAPSNYHVAPRVDNQNFGQLVLSPPNNLNLTPPTVGFHHPTSDKKKRGRPRKYGPDGSFARALSPMPISASVPGGEFPSAFPKKKYKKFSGDWMAKNSMGSHFTPHVIEVGAGQDVTMKLISFSQQGPRAVCIICANGAISNVTLRQPSSSGGTLTYEGRFELLTLTGSFIPSDTDGTRSRTGGMSVSLSGPDGRVYGGSVAGLLVAATSVVVMVGSFLPGNHQDHKAKKPQMSPLAPLPIAYAPGAGTSMPPPVPQPDKDEPQCSEIQEDRKPLADINMSVSEGQP